MIACSPQSVMRSSKKISVELLAITEPVHFRNRRLKAVGESLLTANLAPPAIAHGRCQAH